MSFPDMNSKLGGGIFMQALRSTSFGLLSPIQNLAQATLLPESSLPWPLRPEPTIQVRKSQTSGRIVYV